MHIYKWRLALILAIMLSASLTARAEPLTIQPFVKGSFAEIRTQLKDKPFVVIFWSESCVYCMKELAMFGRLQKQFPKIELIIVATDPFLEETTVSDVLNRSQLELKQTWVFAEQFPEIVYADINKRWRGELPATHFFNREHQETRHMGIIKEQELIQWMTEQST
ncbi:MAG: redoxin domain-containing protein [Gammaproteobacteria bacterium]|nr:redoxin domain-containing protein [Gammaproteobacteria bacterium]